MVNILNADKSSSSNEKRLKLLETKQIFTKELEYNSIKYNTIRYPSTSTNSEVLQSGLYLREAPNETSKIQLLSITTDNIHKGLYNEILNFHLQVVYSNRNNFVVYKLFNIDLTPITRLSYSDDGGTKHLIPLFRQYYLRNIPDYKKMQLLTFGFSIDNSAYTKENSIVAEIEYSIDY